jgi:hypothetical protein
MGASGIFVKRTALNNIHHQIKPTNIRVKGRYAQSRINEIALLDMKLPDFYNSQTVTIQAYVEDKIVGRHDIIFGVRFIQQLGLIFDFKQNTVCWDKITIPMRPLGSFNTDELTAIDYGESETPKSLQEAIKQLERNITENKYSEHNYKEMILKCTHLSTLQ